MNNKINNNEHPYVDLGLPSGTLWSTCNVGASKPSDFGLYFQWGDIQGYTAEQVGKENGKKLFEWDDYKWDLYADGKAFSKYTKAGETLNLEDDAAHINMGGDWRIPSPEQIKELIDNTTTEWILLDDKAFGMAFTSKNGKSIFIPAAGYAWWGSIYDKGSYGYIWSSMVDKDHVCDGKYLYFNSNKVRLSSTYLSDGLPVRGVIDKNSDKTKNKKNNMNDNFNLVEILKDAPKGTKLWSPICGDCELVEVDGENTHPIICRTKSDGGDIGCEAFAANGKFYCDYKNGECVLFPSKENRDWSTFKISKKHKEFKPFQKVLRIAGTDPNHKIWIADFYSHYNEANGKHYLTSDFIKGDDELIPYDGNEDKVGKIVEK